MPNHPPRQAALLVQFSKDRSKAVVIGEYDSLLSKVRNNGKWVAIEVINRAGLTTIYPHQVDKFMENYIACPQGGGGLKYGFF